MIKVLFGFLSYLQAKDYHQFSGLKTTIERSPIFVLLIFFEWLAKVRATGYKVY